MRGSVVYQVQRIFKESGINRIGISKHQDKEAFRQSYDKKATWHDIGQNTGIYSYSTADDYREVWIASFKYIKNAFGVKDIENIKGIHIEDFLYSKIDEDVSHSTFMKYAAALEKLSVALKLYFKKEYNFSPYISKARELAHKELSKFKGSRAYKEPEKIIGRIDNDLFKLIASVQYYAGARIDEIFSVNKDSLNGISIRPYTNEKSGIVTVKGKGGKIRDIYLTYQLYEKLGEYLVNDNFCFKKSTYLNHLKKAAELSNQGYTGSHGLRWNFAQNRMKELQRTGLLYEQCLTIVSQEMGHERADITEHYLR